MRVGKNFLIRFWKDRTEVIGLNGTYGDIVREFCKYAEEEKSGEMVLKCMEIARLERIADALERMNCVLKNMQGSVELLEKLSDCVDEIPQYGNRFIVGGMIQIETKERYGKKGEK